MTGPGSGGRGPFPAAGRPHLGEPTLRLLHHRLGIRSAALAFATAVTRQAAHPLGGAPGRDEGAVAGLVCDLLLGVSSGDPVLALCDDPVLLAAFFQNVDLLYQERDPGADGVSGLVMAALELAAEEQLADDTEGECA